jgi:hypothetical protein
MPPCLQLRSVPSPVSVCFFSLPVKSKKQADTGGREKAMKLEETNNLTENAVNRFVEALESGRSEVLTQYLSAMARFHNYSFLCVQ